MALLSSTASLPQLAYTYRGAKIIVASKLKALDISSESVEVCASLMQRL